MATSGAEDLEYDSDPEELKMSLAMRRREASDDEEGDGSGEKPRVVDRRVPIHSDESDDQGGAADYEEEEEEEEEEDLLRLEDEEEEEEDNEVYEESEPIKKGLAGDGEAAKESEGGLPPEEGVAEADGEDGKKDNEPFAVPTAGAFYMHDDRFRDSAGGRHGRTQGGRKLWESRDERKWGHDKFEEISTHDRRFQEGRSSRGNFRGRGRNRGGEHGFGRGNRPKAYNNNNNNSSSNNNNNNSNINSNNNNIINDSNQVQMPRSVRGKGQRKYEPAMKNSAHQPSMQYKQSGKSNEKPSNANSARAYTSTSSDFEPAPAMKNVFASSLNHASPPFYPSGSSNKETNFTQKRDGHAGNSNKNYRPSGADSAMHRGKNIVDSIGMDKLNIKDSSSPAAGKPLSNIQNSSSGATNTNHSRIHGRANIAAQTAYQPASHQNQNIRGSLSAHAFQRGHTQGRGQVSVQPPSQHLGQRPSSGQASSPPKTGLSITSFESGDLDSSSEAGNSKTTTITKGKGVGLGSGRGSVMYGGAQVIGTTGGMAVTHGDQNFPGAPTFLPVMQFGGQLGGQHHGGMGVGGMGVPAVGMAFPGYVAQPQGLGNTEMTWLPVLAGAAGAYCPPYIPVDGAYHNRPSGQSSSGSASSKENNTSKANSEWKPTQRTEIVDDEFGQRQNKPRRYSEMNFGQ